MPPARREIDDSNSNKGNAIVAFPIGIWERGCHLLGLKDLSMTIGGVDFLYSIVVRDAGINVSDDAS